MTARTFIAQRPWHRSRPSRDRGLLEVDRRSVIATFAAWRTAEPGSGLRRHQGAGVLRSDDGGATWRGVPVSAASRQSSAVSPTQAGVVYAGKARRAVRLSRRRSYLGGADRVQPHPLALALVLARRAALLGYVQAIALSPTDPDRIVVGIEAGATVLSEDGGRSWTCHRPGALRDCHGLAFHATVVTGCTRPGAPGAVRLQPRRRQTWSKASTGLWTGDIAGRLPPTRQTRTCGTSPPRPGPSRPTARRRASVHLPHDGARWQRLEGGFPDRFTTCRTP